jgi:hypothetical protein
MRRLSIAATTVTVSGAARSVEKSIDAVLMVAMTRRPEP